MHKIPRRTGRPPHGTKSSSPTVRRLFELSNLTGAEITERINAGKHSVSRWRSGQNAPSILFVEEFAWAIGYEIVLVKKNNDEGVDTA